MLNGEHCRALPSGERDRAAAGAPGPARIIAIQGTGSRVIQDLIAALAREWVSEGCRVAGVVEETLAGVRKSNGGSVLRNLRTGATYESYQDLGPHATACCLDDRGVTEACQHVIVDLPACDVVVLSKFGKLESERSGLFGAFIAAADLGKLVITAVSPAYSACYLDFVGALGAIVAPDDIRFRAWSRTLFAQAPLD